MLPASSEEVAHEHDGRGNESAGGDGQDDGLSVHQPRASRDAKRSSAPAARGSVTTARMRRAASIIGRPHQRAEATTYRVVIGRLGVALRLAGSLRPEMLRLLEIVPEHGDCFAWSVRGDHPEHAFETAPRVLNGVPEVSNVGDHDG